MKILFITKKFPYPIRDGETIAIKSLATGLHQAGGCLHLFALNTTKHHIQIQDTHPIHLPYFTRIYSHHIDNAITVKGAILNLFSPHSYFISRYWNAHAASQLQQLITTENYDIIQFEGLQTMCYAPAIKTYFGGKVVLRAHNIEHRIYQRQIPLTPNIIKRQYLTLQTNRLKSQEKALSSLADCILPVSDVDGSFFAQYQSDILITPIGYAIDHPAIAHRLAEGSKTHVGFIGSLDWGPNVQGLDWFLQKVWSKTSKTNQFQLHIAGRHADTYHLPQDDANITFWGELDDSSAFWEAIEILIVPLHAGSGTRVKIIESLAKGKLVISTTIGAEGLPLENDKNILIADSPAEWMRLFEQIADQKIDTQAIIQQGTEYVARNHDIYKIGKRVMEHYHKILQKH